MSSAPVQSNGPRFKLGVVLAGYLGAFAVASLAVVIRVASTDGSAAQAASGMHAAGDFFLFCAVFGTVGLLPTGDQASEYRAMATSMVK